MCWIWGSGCGPDGRVVTSNSRGPWFESSHQQTFMLNIYCRLYWKDENKEKESGNGPFCKFWQCRSLVNLWNNFLNRFKKRIAIKVNNCKIQNDSKYKQITRRTFCLNKLFLQSIQIKRQEIQMCWYVILWKVNKTDTTEVEFNEKKFRTVPNIILKKYEIIILIQYYFNTVVHLGTFLSFCLQGNELY